MERGKKLGFGVRPRDIPASWTGLRNDWTTYDVQATDIEPILGPDDPPSTHGVATRVQVKSATGPSIVATGVCPGCSAAFGALARVRDRGVDGGCVTRATMRTATAQLHAGVLPVHTGCIAGSLRRATAGGMHGSCSLAAGGRLESCAPQRGCSTRNTSALDGSWLAAGGGEVVLAPDRAPQGCIGRCYATGGKGGCT